jgi:hypothetical protein
LASLPPSSDVAAKAAAPAAALAAVDFAKTKSPKTEIAGAKARLRLARAREVTKHGYESPDLQAKQHQTLGH